MAPAERRASLIAATRPLLLEHGLSLSTRQIAEAAGVAEGTIFRVFPTKDELIHAVIHDTLDPSGICADIEAIDARLPLEERLVALVTLLQAQMRVASTLFAALHVVSSENRDVARMHHPPHGDAFAHRQRAHQLARSITALIEPDAACLTVPVAQAVSLIRGVAMSSAHPLFSDGVLTDPRTIVHILLHGLTSAPGTTGRPDTDRGNRPSPEPRSPEPRSPETHMPETQMPETHSLETHGPGTHTTARNLAPTDLTGCRLTADHRTDHLTTKELGC